MKIENIRLTNFRNYKTQEIDLIPGINLFVGDNANGKTNIIESVYVSSFGKPYRTTKDVELIKFGEKYSRIEIIYNEKDVKNKIEYYIDENNKKIIKQNDIKVSKLSEHVGKLLIVIFSPDSLDIVKGAPSKRRSFLDMICSQLSKLYFINLQEYMKCLKLKNSILKNQNIDKEYINILHEKMSDYIFFIVNFRKKVIEKLEKKAIGIQMDITNKKENIKLEYITDFLDKNKEQIKEILNLNFNIEVLRKSSIKGIQRDDIEILVNDMEVSKFGSQGQNRTALLTLKLANFEILKEEKEETPILLLDDIMSELDQNRIRYLLEYIKDYQSIITTTDATFAKNVENIKISEVKEGNIFV